jgi:peptidoglycan DL-endopeptidase LytF
MQVSMSGIHPDFAQENKPPKQAVRISRKDTIIIAMLVNIALLATLFATASRQSLPAPKVETVVTKVEIVAQPVPQVTKVVTEPVDEIDEILKTYTQTAPKTTPAPESLPTPVPKPEPVITKAIQYKEVTVKKGDVLSRIAKQHGVDMKDIILLNHLDNAK